MSDINEMESALNHFCHDLFLENGYIEWRRNLKSFEAGKWHSLIVGLDNHDAPLERLLEFGENVYSKFVFNYVKAPDYRDSKMLMIQFTISESMWHSLVWHCPERN